MNDQVNPQPPDGRRSPLNDQMELLRFLREEAEANRKAQREEADSNRKLLADTVTYASAALARIVTVAGFFWFRDFTSFKEALKKEAETGAKTEVDSTLKAEFQKDQIQRTIQKAAEVAAQKEAKPLIEAGVKSQVQDAVAQQSGMIRKIAEQAVNGKVQAEIKPIVRKVSESAAELQIHELIVRANADDALAFDEIARLKDSASASQRRLIKGIIADRNNLAHAPFRAIEQQPLRCSITSPTDAQYSHSVAERVQAVADCFSWFGKESDLRYDTSSVLGIEERIIPDLVKIALDDPSLAVRASAVFSINSVFMGSPGFYGFYLSDHEKLKDWWYEK